MEKFFKCDDCMKTFSTRGNLHRHRRAKHSVAQREIYFSCNNCGFKSETLVLQHSHWKKEHQKSLTNCCMYCKNTFGDVVTFGNHVENVHGLPLPSSSAPVDLPSNISAFKGALQVFKIEGDRSMDLLEFMLGNEQEISQILRKTSTKTPRKVQFAAAIVLTKAATNSEEDHDERVTMFAVSGTETVFFDGLSHETFLAMTQKMINSVAVFASGGSGWCIETISYLEIKISKFSPIRGRSYLALPPELQKTRNLLLNIKNVDDHNCFLYCFRAAYQIQCGPDLLSNDRNSTWCYRTSPWQYSSENPEAKKIVGEFEMPMGLNQIQKFEEQNNVSINVFSYEKNELVPLKISKRVSESFIVDLLLLSDGIHHHYVLVLDLKRLICFVGKKNYRARDVLCRNCFHLSSSDEHYQRHSAYCSQKGAAVITMPVFEKSSLKFQRVQARWFAPVCIYFDVESLIKPIATCSGNPLERGTYNIEAHHPCGVAFTLIELGSHERPKLFLKRSSTCMEWFVEELERLAHDLFTRKQTNREYIGDVPQQTSDLCWICSERIIPKSASVLDHCHFTGEFLGWSHSKCNLNRKVLNYTPVICHNLQNYDLHHVCKALFRSKPSSFVTVIPSTTEKYISLTIHVLVKEYFDKKGKKHCVYEQMRFIDSYKFMASSLEQLVDNLPREKFGIFESHFEEIYNLEEISLLKQKGFYPYSYMSNEARFDETSLPLLSDWKNSLQNGEISITEAQLDHANQVFDIFCCSSLGDYHDLYLTTDVLLLACVFEEFRKLCYSTYGLDCVQYYTASNLCGDALLKCCEHDLHLLTDRDCLEITENLMRGGVSSSYSKRLFKPNNKYLADYDQSTSSTFGLMLDANNLYGGVMEKYPLPEKNFSVCSKTTIDELLATSRNSQFGFIVECDLDYPDHLHDTHQDFPLAPTKEVVQFEWLSDVQKSLLGENLLPCQNKTTKLLQTLYPKQNYTLHYLTLQFYVEQGLVVTKLHRVLKFEQSLWMKPYIVKNTEKRKAATNKFETNFFKLMNNSAYGKMMESKRKRKQLQLVKTSEQVVNAVSKSYFSTFTIFDENLAAISSEPRQIYWDKPTVVGAVILDLAKLHMFWFHYQIMKKNFDCALIYSDTDSLLYQINSKDFYQDLKEKSELHKFFDFSNYLRDDALYDPSNKMETLMFKDELGGTLIKEFCCLKPKLYSLLSAGDRKLSAKGVSKATRKELHHDLFKEVLFNGFPIRRENTRISSAKHLLFTSTTNKICLSSFDNKRFLLPDKVHSLPFGHFRIRSQEKNCNSMQQLSQVMTIEGEEEMIEQEFSCFTHSEEFINTSWTAPDPGLNRTIERESDLDENEVFDFNRDMEVPSTYNPFILYEAEEAERNEASQPKRSRLYL